jgi:hypothetical protein
LYDQVEMMAIVVALVTCVGGFDGLNRGTGAAARRLAWTPLKVVITNFRAGWLRAPTACPTANTP